MENVQIVNQKKTLLKKEVLINNFSFVGLALILILFERCV